MITALTSDTVMAFAHGAGWGPGPWFIIFPILWFLLFVTVIFLFARRARRGWSGGPWGRSAADPLSILGERYARGEIDESEYRARLEVLTRRP